MAEQVYLSAGGWRTGARGQLPTPLEKAYIKLDLTKTYSI